MSTIIRGSDGIDTSNVAPKISPAFTGIPTVNGEVIGGSYGFKNYIINGNFDIWQYKDAGLTYPQTSSAYGSDDRWGNANLGSTKTHSQIACTDVERALFNASYFSRTVVTSVVGANNVVLKQQSIENVTRLAGKTVTLSFWAKADSSKNIEVRFLQTFGGGGSPSANVNNIGQQLVALTTTWQKKTITVTLPSIVGKTLGTNGIQDTATWLRFIFDAGASYEGNTVGQQSGTFDIAQVQLEEGSVATPFEQRPVGLELSLCQRYYGKLNSYYMRYDDAITNGTYGCSLNYPVRPRVIPTISLSSLNVNSTTAYVDNITTESIRVMYTWSGTGPVARDIFIYGTYLAEL